MTTAKQSCTNIFRRSVRWHQQTVMWHVELPWPLQINHWVFLADILSGILSGSRYGRSSDILSGILSGISYDILSGISSDILSGRSSDILFYLANLVTFYLAHLLTFYLYLLTFYLANLLTFYLAFSLPFYMALFLAVEVRLKSGEAHGAPNLAGWSPRAESRRLKSGEAHSAPNLAGWSPARPTARRIWPVEVRRGPQRAESRRLKSGEAHSAPNLAGWSPARPTALGPSLVEVRRGPCAPNLAGWRPSPVEVWRSTQRSDSRRLKSGEDHCYQELANEIWRGSLRSRAGRWGPARKKEEGGRRKEATRLT